MKYWSKIHFLLFLFCSFFPKKSNFQINIFIVFCPGGVIGWEFLLLLLFCDLLRKLLAVSLLSSAQLVSLIPSSPPLPLSRSIYFTLQHGGETTSLHHCQHVISSHQWDAIPNLFFNIFQFNLHIQNIIISISSNC